jgi:protein gp37
MNRTSIEWTNLTWNPLRAKHRATGKTGTFCTRISPGCTNCYASAINKRFGNGLEYTAPNLPNVEFYLDERILQEPLKLKKPSKIFVGDMFALFHEAISFQMIREVFAVAEACDWHVLQFLTKRAQRMLEFMQWWEPLGQGLNKRDHIWLGVSVESQKYADERIPLLLQTPAAVRFLSVEPQLEAVDLSSLDGERGYRYNALCSGAPFGHYQGRKVDWVICGGESGPGARPFNLAWAESLQAQCKAAGVAFFMKQVGSKPEFGDKAIYYRPTNRKGGDMSEWPENLRVREFPVAKPSEALHSDSCELRSTPG